MNLLGFSYAEARYLLAEGGKELHRIRITRPPRGRLGVGRLRVVRERWKEGQLELVLAYEDYEEQRGARPRGASSH